jgi:hypothetical protein
MILQLCSAAGALNRTARFIEQCDLVGALLTSNWQLHDEVFGRPADFEGRLIRLSRVLSARHRALTEIQDSRFPLLHWTLSAHPQPCCYRDNQNRSSGQPDLGATPLTRRLLAQFGEFVKARTA